MSVEENKASIRRMVEEGINGGNLSVVDELVRPDAVEHDAPPGTDAREHYKGIITMLHTAFPDVHFALEDMIGEGDRVACRISMTGTHRSPFMGLPPSGRRFCAQQIRIIRFVDGKTAETWSVRDDLAMMRQLGALPRITQP
jgi:predicted ester cyclase